MECPICRVNENGVWRRNFGSPTPEQNLADEADQDVDDPQESIPMVKLDYVCTNQYFQFRRGCKLHFSFSFWLDLLGARSL